MTIFAIDPGPVESQFIAWDGSVIEHGFLKNDVLLEAIPTFIKDLNPAVCIEGIASYGMAVGKEVFETCIWIGRFYQVATENTPCHGPTIVYRMAVKMHLCHSTRAKDGNVRQALIDRFGKPGTKNQPGILHGISKHAWAALALAVTHADTLQTGTSS